jgi:heptosyltransferase-3
MLRRNILIFHAGALGDFVLAWPLALGLGRALAQSRIIFITQQQKGLLAEQVLRLESADMESGWHGLHADGKMALPARATSLLAGAQAIYTFLSPTPAWLANVKRLSGEAKVVALSTRPAAGYAGHAVDWLLEQLAEHPVERAATQQMLRSIGERGIGAAPVVASGGGVTPVNVLIHPGSGSATKCWPLECFVNLARRLTQAGQSVRFIIGEVERERWTASAMAQLAGVAEVHEPKTYLELLAEIRSARQFIGNDSGPGHLAGIVGVATLSIFGPASSEWQWKPLGPRVIAVGGDSWEEVTVDRVMGRLGGKTDKEG